MSQEYNIRISISRKGNPYNNTFAESFIKTLKWEEVYLNEYETFEDAIKNIQHFIEKVYNKKRVHSALGYRSPDQFEMEVALNTVASTIRVQSNLILDLLLGYGSKKSFYKIFLRFNKPE